ncbi:MAG: M1 family aminopeptidase [Vicinamibacteraceae bacterium]
MLGLAVASGASLSAQPAAAPASTDAGLAALYARLEQALVAGEPSQILATTSPAAAANGDRLSAFAQSQASLRAVRAVVRERDRAPLDDAAEGTGFRMLLEVFLEYPGGQAAARTWTIDATLTPADGAWRLADAEALSSADGLYRLALDPSRQYRVRNLVVRAEDLQLTFPAGVAYAALTPEGETGLIVIGDGTMQFTPKPPMEQGQLRIFAGESELRAPIGATFLRYHPVDRSEHVNGTLTEEPVSASSLRRAQAIFEDEIGKSFGIELGDLSHERWSLVPPVGDFLAEIRTKGRFGTLTYVRSGGEAEDISVFQRARRRNISVYASTHRLKTRGSPSFNEDDDADYDVSHYSISATIDPDRQQIEGRAEMRLTVRAPALGTLTLRLAESLNVYGVVADNGLGRLLALRVRGQNSVLVNLPRALVRGTTVTLTITYGGRLSGANPDREAIAPQQDTAVHEEFALTAEPRLVYSNRSYWYPQSQVTDYATGVLRLTVPERRACVASGTPASGNPVRVTTTRGTSLRYVFLINQPARYFSAVISRLGLASDAEVTEPTPISVAVHANPRQMGRGRALSAQAAAILSVYGEVLGDYPYRTLTLAAVDDALPGGHSPAYFALVNQPLPASKFTWANDPVAFEGYPQFFLAHEIAHQYWGGAVGWESYHEQWISEGFAQYFALLYAERSLDAERVLDIRRKLRTTATTYGDQGPIWLGYRLGHLQEDGRVFRALLYNKSAMVLHMLRRWVGDDAFFRGLRALYTESRYTKIGTRHVQRAFESASGLDLNRFFESWIRSAETPRLRLSFEAAGKSVSVRIDQLGPVTDVPVTVSVVLASGAIEDHVVKLSEGSTFVQLPASGPVRAVELNRDEQALVVVERGSPPRTRTAEPVSNNQALQQLKPSRD